MTNCTKTFLALAAIAMAIPVTNSAQADLIVSSSAPTVDGADIANLVWDNNPGDEKLFADTPNPGQSFTTGNDALGYSLSSFSLQVNRDSEMTTGHGLRTWNVRVVAIDGANNTTTLANETGHIQAAGTFAIGDWFNWNLFAPVNLAPNTLYGVDVEHVTGNDWPQGLPYMRREGNDFAGGTFYQRTGGNPGGDGDPSSINPNAGRDFIFHANMSAIPEPASGTLLALGGLAMLLTRRRS